MALVCCNNTFRTQDAFQEHKTTHTRGQHSYECRKCSYKCPTMGQMVAHRIIHNRENIAVLEEESKLVNKPWFVPEGRNIAEEGSQYVGDDTRNDDEIQQDLNQVENDSTSEDSDSDSNINEEAYSSNSDKDLDSEKDNTNESDNEENFIATASKQYSKYDYFVNNTLENRDTDWTCFICDTVFQDESLFEEHVRNHSLTANLKSNVLARSNIFKFACEHCDFKCEGIEQFDMHKKSHYKNTAHTCKKCQRNFRTNSQLKRHDTKVHRNTYMCDLCPFKTNHPTSLARHVERTHKEEDIAFMCKLCPFKTKHQTSLVRHVKLIHHKKNVSNSKTRQSDTTESASNEITKNSNETEAISSFETRQSDTTESASNEITKISNETEAISCFETHQSDTTESASNEITKISNETEAISSFGCEVCEYTCTSNIELVEHMKSHKAIYECKPCGRKFKSKEVLKYHILFHNKQTDVKEDLTCKICEKSFPSKMNLESHMVTHSNEKLFQCMDCNYKSKWKSNLNIHEKRYHNDKMVTHSNEKLFQCMDCNYKSNRKINLDMHIKRHHKDDMVTHPKSNDKPFQFHCQFCDYKSKWKKGLNTHMKRRHNNEHQSKPNEQSENNLNQEGTRAEKIYVCNFCEYQTKSASSLKVHVNDNHPIKEKDSHPINDKDNHPIKEKDSHPINDKDNHPIKEKDSHPINDEDNHLINDNAEYDRTERFFYCNFCDYKSKFTGNLDRHTLRRHKDKYNESSKIKIMKIVLYKKVEEKTLESVTKISKTKVFKTTQSQQSTFTKLYTCKFCFYKSIYKGSLKKHVLTFHKNGSYESTQDISQNINKEVIPHVKFKKIDSLKIGSNKESKPKKLYGCSYCEYTTKWSVRGIRLHMKYKHGKQGIVLVKIGNEVIRKIEKKSIIVDKKEKSVELIQGKDIDSSKVISNKESKSDKKGSNELTQDISQNINKKVIPHVKLKKIDSIIIGSNKKSKPKKLYGCSYCEYTTKWSARDIRLHMKHKHGKQGIVLVKIGNKVIRKIEKKSIIVDKKEKSVELMQGKDIDSSKVISNKESKSDKKGSYELTQDISQNIKKKVITQVKFKKIDSSKIGSNKESKSNKLYGCIYCAYTSKWSPRDVRLHMKNIHGKDGIVRVKMGTKAVQKIKKKAIKADEKEESVDLKQYHCSFCDYISKRSSNDVHNHMMNIHGKDGNIIMKKVVKKSIKTVKKTISSKKDKKLINRNKNDKTEKKPESKILKNKLKPTPQKVHSCYICRYTSYRKDSLDEHLTSHNQGSGPVIFYKCPECLQCYINKASLISHLESHSGTSFDGPRICPGCNKILSNRRNAFKHIEKCLS